MTEPFAAIKPDARDPVSGADPSAPAPDPKRMIAMSSAAALVIEADGGLAAANGPGEQLARAWRDGEPELLAAVETARRTGTLYAVTWTIRRPGEERSIDLTVVPLACGRVLLAGRDQTLERKLARSLMVARERFGAFMKCAADFGWETDAQGVFTYVTPGGAYGLDPDEMIGRRAAELFAPLEETGHAPFTAHAPLELDGHWVALPGTGGAKAALRIAARPRFGKDGRWAGARGIVRDVTETATKANRKALEQARQTLIAQIVLAIRADEAPEKILRSVARTLGVATGGRACWVLLRDGTVTDSDNEDDSMPALEAARQRLLQSSDWVREDETSVDLPSPTVLVARAASGRHLAAALLMGRNTDQEPWRAHEVELVSQVITQLGIAIKQAALIERLKHLSRVDDLTNLLNRRAFMEEVERRLSHHDRTGRTGALLYVDLDKFKVVNDSQGHAVGDRVLQTLGRLLGDNVRIGDLAGRLGGDEFALWLEETGQEGAVHKARSILEIVPRLRQAAGDANSPLGLSIGIALSRPGSGETLDLLTERADKALYRVKRGGRGTYAFAKGDGTDAGEARGPTQ